MQDNKNVILQMRFPQKLWYLLNLRTDALIWGGTGRTILLNYRILLKYLQCEHSIFKTTNISSFVRQLNLYGFRKVTSHLQDPLCNSSNPYMHEYVHHYFQYGRQELLNKITRKAITMKKNFKTKNLSSTSDSTLNLTPLKKARRALRLALWKAAQDLNKQNPPQQFNDFTYEGEDNVADDYCEDEETVELDWVIPNKEANVLDHSQPGPLSNSTGVEEFVLPEEHNSFEVSSQDIMNFKFENSQQSNENFPAQFLSMPDLEPEPGNTGVELLAEFDIDHDTDQSVTRRMTDKENSQNSLNCILPSVSHDHIDDVTMLENNNDIGHYNGEWDQMFCDMMTNRSSSQENSSELKELYSHISRTIDLLNT